MFLIIEEARIPIVRIGYRRVDGIPPISDVIFAV